MLGQIYIGGMVNRVFFMTDVILRVTPPGCSHVTGKVHFVTHGNSKAEVRHTTSGIPHDSIRLHTETLLY